MQTTTEAQIQELLLHIGNSKDENGSKYAVKRLEELLGGAEGHGVAFLFQERVRKQAGESLFKLWDCGVAKNAAPHYVENFCRIFQRAGLSRGLVHPKRVRIVHSLLSSGNRTKVSCGLHVLKDAIESGAGELDAVGLILDSVDFSLGALNTIGVPPKVAGGKLMNATARDQDGSYARMLWNTRDLAKSPTRVAYVDLFNCMIRACKRDPRTLARVLELRGFVGSVLNYVSRDPWGVQEQVLRVVQEGVLRLDDVEMTPVTKWVALAEGKFVGQLAQILDQARARLDDEGESRGDEKEEETVRSVLELASEILTRIMIIVGGTSASDCSRMAETLLCASKRAAKPMLGLRPTRCCEHARAMHRAFERSSSAAALYLRDVSHEVDFKKMGTFLVNASLLVRAYNALSRQFLKCSEPIQSTQPELWRGTSQSLDILSTWTAVFPTNGMSKAALAKGLQHSQPLVSHVTVVLLNSMLEALEHAIACFAENGTNNTETRAKMLEHSKRHLPGVQLVIGYHSKVKFDSLREDTASCTLSGILKLLRRWGRLFPEAFVEENVQIERMLLHERVLVLHPENRLELVRVLRDFEDQSNKQVGYSITGLDIIFKLALREPSESTETYRACAQLATAMLAGTGLIIENSRASKVSGASLWSKHVCKRRKSSDAIVDFFVEAMKMAMKKPMTYVEMVERWELSDMGADAVVDEYISPLLVCSMEKMCRILKSKAKDDQYKADVVSFVRAVLEETMAASTRRDMYVLLIMHVLNAEFPGVTEGLAGIGAVTGNGDTKRERSLPCGKLSEAMRFSLVDSTGFYDPSILDWMIKLYEEGCCMQGKSKGGRFGERPTSKRTRAGDEVFPDGLGPDGSTEARALLKSLDKAKKGSNKYERRLRLARMVPKLVALLSRPEQLSDEDLYALREAFSGPIVQYFASKDIKVPEGAGLEDAAHFSALQSLSPEIVVSTLGGGPDREARILELAAPMLQLKDRKSSNQSYCNASLPDKLRVLKAVVTTLAATSTSSSSNPTDALASFVCEAAIMAMTHLRSHDLARQRSMDLIESLGDIISEFGEYSRDLEAFDRMIDAWSNIFVPSVMGDNGQTLELTRCLRRFSASLIPDDDRVALVSAKRGVASAMYDDVCSLFFELITKEFVQETLRSDAPIRMRPAYLASTMPLKSIVACATLGTMTWNTFTYRDGDDATQLEVASEKHKVEMCEFLETMLEIIALMERDLPSDEVARHATSFEKAEAALMKYLMATYHASLTQGDMATWSLVRVINERLWRRQEGCQEPVGSRISDESMLLALIHGPVSTNLNYFWGLHSLDDSLEESSPMELVLPLRCAVTVVDFPEWRHLISSDRLPDSMTCEDAPPEHFMSYEAAGYDPAFFLPMCLSVLQDQSLAEKSSALQHLVTETAALPLIIRCLGSMDACIRAMAYECLALIERAVPPLFEEERRDVGRIRLLLNWVRQSTVTPFYRFPSIHAVFAAEVAHVLFHPESDVYPVATKHLCKSAAMDFTRIISVGSKSIHRDWMHHLLICGLRSSSDVHLYTKSHVFELSMALVSSTQQSYRDLAVMLVHQAGSIPKAARVMTESCGALGWLAHAILKQRQRCDHGDEKALLILLESAWRRMTSWKGIVERGTVRMRASASRDLAIAETHLKRGFEL